MTAADEITYVDAAPAIPTHLGTDAAHVHHRDTDRCLRAPDGVACPTPAELRAEVERLRAWRKDILDEGFGYDDSEESATEVLEYVSVWRAVASGTDDRVRDLEAEVGRLRGLQVEHIEEGLAGSDALVEALVRAESAEAERDALQQQVVDVLVLLPDHYPECVCVRCEIRATLAPSTEGDRS